MKRILIALPRSVAAFVLSAGLLFGSASQAQSIDTIAGNGTFGYSGDGGAATSASLAGPYDVVVDAAGNRYIADLLNHRIRKLTPAGVITTVAGNGTSGFSGDGGQATSAQVGNVYQLAVDAAGALYLADFSNNRVRKVSPSGVISTIAGNDTPGFSGDGGPATSAGLRRPWGIAVDGAGNVYFSDYENHRVRMVTPAGIISTVAGNGIAGFGGDGGQATSAGLSYPLGISIDTSGNLYIADQANNRIRKVTSSGIISTVAGNGAVGFSGDGGPATSASFRTVRDVAADNSGNLYVSDSGNYRIRKISSAGGISTIAGNGTRGFSGDGGPAINASINYSTGVATDAAGDMLFTDQGNNRVRKVVLFTSCSAEGYYGAKMTLCRQVCEIDQSPSRLLSLIKLYTAIYRSEPPCSR